MKKFKEAIKDRLDYFYIFKFQHRIGWFMGFSNRLLWLLSAALINITGTMSLINLKPWGVGVFLANLLASCFIITTLIYAIKYVKKVDDTDE